MIRDFSAPPATLTLTRPLPCLPDLQQAVGRAQARWPALAPALGEAAALVQGAALSLWSGPGPILAYRRPTADQPGHWISHHLTGLACTCDHWPPARPAGPGDGRYCPDILAYLLLRYQQLAAGMITGPSNWSESVPDQPPLPAELWPQVLADLRLQMTRLIFNDLLLESRLLPTWSSSKQWTVAVPNARVQARLTGYLMPMMERVIEGLVGYRPQVLVVVVPLPT